MIEPLQNDDDARACAAMMIATDPWITLRRTFDEALRSVTDPASETYVAREDGAVRGFISINMRGAFNNGYIRIVCVAADARGSGVGSRLVAFAEERILRTCRNVFLCVSSFNPRARALYERLGYETVGEMRDYVIAGASEIIMRKSTGPLITSHAYRPDPARPDGA
jgi:ribosomal protein S18 acetylase RimI-like enzyme